MNTDLIFILDLGGSQAYYTARRLRGEQFYCEVLDANTPLEQVLSRNPKGIILAGGDSDSEQTPALPFDPEAFGVPLLAFGGAARMLAERIGAERQGTPVRGGKDFVQFKLCDLFSELSENDRFFERIDEYVLPEDYLPIAVTPAGLSPAFGNLYKNIYGLQFYVESNDPDGLKILENFAEFICKCPRNWSVDNYAPILIEHTRSLIGDASIMLPVTGGLDSAVTAALLSRAVGSKLTCIYIDSGLLRKGDPELVQKSLHEQMGLNLIIVDARERFMKLLKGVCDPEEKRRLLYNELSTLYAEEYIKSGNAECMAEGTIYSDVLRCKPKFLTHMIDGCRIIEPLRLLFKEEVRTLGRFLGVPEELLKRPSFASTGLSARCLGEVTPEKLAILREADAIFRQEVEKAGLDRKIAQYFAILTDMKTPGVHGEGYVCALRALGSSSAGRAAAYKLPYDLMDAVVTRITTEVPGINHVVYDITGRPTAAVEWE